MTQTLTHTIRITALAGAVVVGSACDSSSSDPESASGTPAETTRPSGPASEPNAPRASGPDGFEARVVDRSGHRIRAWEQRGDEPAIVLMHGFPDNHHLYDRLVPYLAGRHVVVFDFLGWGESDKPSDYDYTFANQTGDLDAVVTGLALQQVVLVPHDASGPPAINWALDHPDKVAAIVALNTFYSIAPDVAPARLRPGIRAPHPAFRRVSRCVPLAL